MNKYRPTIGLEIHVELKTNSKMFCSCRNNLEEKKPNVNICPVCMAHPGSLPVINKEAVKNVLKVGLALNSRLADFTEFDRKNYFYPDIPKGYQISQYKYPLVSGGELVGVKITRIHLEEDTAKSIHDRGDFSLIDYNRAGVPLMELVTEPVIEDGETAVRFAKELQLILRYLNVSDADMEKGQMRIEANISVAPKSQINADNKTQINADSKSGLLYEDLTYKIRGIAFSIYNQLGSGHKESVYQNALEEELKKNNILYEREKNIAVIYANKKIGSYQPDFVIENKIILEIKALPFVGKIEKKQIQHYLKGSQYKLGLLINFGSSPMCIERVIYDLIRENQFANPRESVLGTKVEVKNLNSFRAVELSINYEIKRQTEMLERGEKIKQETRGWDDKKQITFSQREKEFSHDYRYFPEPDLPKLKISEIEEFSEKSLSKEIPELPSEKRGRYKKEYEIKSEDIEIYITNEKLRKLFEETIKEFKNNKNFIKLVSNYITSDIVGFSKMRDGGVGKIESKNLARLIKMIEKNSVSSRGAKDILLIMYENGGNPEEIAKSKNLFQMSDKNQLKEIVEKIIIDNQKVVEDYKKGNGASLQYLIGQGMKKSKGSANPKALKEIFESVLKLK